MHQLSALIQIDYQTFLTLSDEDLKEVGVFTFGARRKMLLAIAGKIWISPDSGLNFHLSALGGIQPLLWKRQKLFIFLSELNKSKRRLSDTPAVKPGYLEGGASGRLPRIMDVDAAQSNQW